MTDAAKANFANQRNEDFGPLELHIQNDDGSATDLTGWAFSMLLGTELGMDTPDLVLGGLATANGSYIRMIEAGLGAFEVFIARADCAALPGEPDEDEDLYYNIIAAPPGTPRRVVAKGCFIVQPGVGIFIDNTGSYLVTADGSFLVTADHSFLRTA